MGYITFISYLNQYGSDEITITIFDRDTPAPDGLSSSVMFTVNVSPVDDTPIAQDDTPSSIDEDSDYVTIDVLANDSDPEGTVFDRWL